MRLGLCDKKEDQLYFNPDKYGITEVDSETHQQVAYEAALQSIALLKNDAFGMHSKGVLPLQRGLKLLLVGPHAEAQEAFLSNYHGWRCPGGDHDFSCVKSPLEAIRQKNGAAMTQSVKGCGVWDHGGDNIDVAVAKAALFDAVVLLVGIDTSQEAEEKDRVSCELPGKQSE